jgi:hypothetical protein
VAHLLVLELLIRAVAEEEIIQEIPVELMAALV